MLLRRAAAADDGAGAGAGRPRLFAVPRLLVGFARCGAPDCDSPAARSPTSPLDLRAFAALGGSLLRSPRSPRSWESQRVGLGGLVDTLDEAAAAEAKNRLLGPQMRPAFKRPHCVIQSHTSQPINCSHASPELRNVETAAVAVAGAGGKSVPCGRSYGDLKSGPEVVTVPGGAQLGASSHSADLAKFPAPGSLPASIGGPRRYIGSVSATEVEQSEDYTCIIAHGPNPKTTRIFGDCILEPCIARVPDGECVEAVELKEGADSYWLVKCSGDAGKEVLDSSCLSCNKKLDGNDGCIYRGGKEFCCGNCRDQEILTEEEEEKSTAVSSLSSVGSSSSFNDDIFVAGMVVLTGPFDAQLP